MVDSLSAAHIALALVLCTDSVVIPYEMLAFPAPCVTTCKNIIYLIAWFIGRSFVGKHNNHNNKHNNISLLLLFCISDQFSWHGTNSIILECLAD